MQGTGVRAHLSIHADARHMAHHHTPNIQLLESVPRLVQVMREHCRLQPILAVIGAACQHGVQRTSCQMRIQQRSKAPIGTIECAQ